MWWLLSAWVAGDFFLLCSAEQADKSLLLLGALWCWGAVRRSRLAPLLLVLAGLSLSQGFLNRQLASWLPMALNNVPVVIEGQVTDLPVLRPAQGRRPASQVIELSSVTLQDMPTRWPGSHRVRLYGDAEPVFHPGDKLRLRVRLLRPRGFANQGSTDMARLSLARGEDASGSLLTVLEQTPGFAPVDQWRDRISQHIRSRLAAYPQAAGLVPALVVGDWRYLTPASWQLYQNTGVAHLVVISGEHLTLVAGLVWLLLRFACVPLLVWRSWRISAQQWALLPALALAAGYCLLAGWSVSTLRALIMLAIWFTCRLLLRRWPRQRVLALALLVVLIWQPLSPLSDGFWLSFLAVGLLLLVADGRPGLVSLQCLMSLVLGALAALLFSQWNLVGVLANLILIPVFSFVLVPAALVGALVPGMGWLLPLLAPIISLQEFVLERLLAWSPALPIPAHWLATALLMLALLVLMVRFLPWPRWSLPFLLLPWLVPVSTLLANGEFEAIFFDVGQGQASVIRTTSGLVMYDMGPAWQSTDAGARIVRPWFLKQRQPVLLAFASHGDDDHVGGLQSLRDLIPPGKLLSGEPWRVIGSTACVAGQHWRFSGVDFRVLWPPVGAQMKADNAYSCVVKVEGKHGSVLLTGDIPRPVEYELAEQVPLQTTVLQLPHHGSATSNSYAFLRATAPAVVVASVGYLNRLGHPAVQVQRRLLQLGIPLLRTDRDGMLTLRFDKQGKPVVDAWRQHRSPWEDPYDGGLLSAMTNN